MTDLLDQITEALGEAETQIVREFQKIQESSAEPEADDIARLSDEFRDEMHVLVKKLRKDLEHSGLTRDLHLATEHHEEIRKRLYVIDQLLDRQIPMEAFQHARIQLRNIKISSAAGLVSNPRQKDGGKPGSAVPDSRSILDSIKAFFGNIAAQNDSGKLRNVEKESLGPRQIYLDTGIYDAAQQLAMLMLVVTDSPLLPPKLQPGIRGKANFEARDLSSTLSDLPVKTRTPREAIAQTPEEIRRKLESRKLNPNTGKAVFEATDVQSTVAQKAGYPKATLETAKPQVVIGKATFVSRDLKSIALDTQKLREKLPDRHVKHTTHETDDKSKNAKKP